MTEFNDEKKKGGCLKGCLFTFLGFAVLAIVVAAVVVKVVVPKVTAEFLVTQATNLGPGSKPLSVKDIDGAIKTLDGIDDKKMNALMQELKTRPITNSRETVDLVLNRLGVEGVDNARRKEIADSISVEQMSNMVAALKENPAATTMSIGMIKGIVRDTLVEMKKRKAASGQ